MWPNTEERRDGQRFRAGVALLTAAVVLFMGILLAEVTYPGYSISGQAISALGHHYLVPAVLFDTSSVLFGCLVVYAAVQIFRCISKMLGSVLAISGVGAFVVGTFNAGTIFAVHGTGALAAFVLGAAAVAISSVVIFASPIRYFVMGLALISFAGMVLFGLGYAEGTGRYFGLGLGGAERLVVYPLVLWGLATGGYLVRLDSRATSMAGPDEPTV